MQRFVTDSVVFTHLQNPLYSSYSWLEICFLKCFGFQIFVFLEVKTRFPMLHSFDYYIYLFCRFWFKPLAVLTGCISLHAHLYT